MLFGYSHRQETFAAGAAVPPPYLVPYLRAAARHGPAFASLLWAAPQTQAARFDAFARLCDMNGRSILDVGCGRADLLDFLLGRGIRPSEYIGLEAVPELIAAVARKQPAVDNIPHSTAPSPSVTIIHADFIREPKRLFVAADIVLCSGSLNTLADSHFYQTLRLAYDAAVQMLAFNFLASPILAGADYLYWREREHVLSFARGLSSTAQLLDDYLEGDCTIAIHKPSADTQD
jgi:hypothetical protein